MRYVALLLPEDMKSLRSAKIELAQCLEHKDYDFIRGFLDEVIIELPKNEPKRKWSS